jgi:hypothetical protein
LARMRPDAWRFSAAPELEDERMTATATLSVPA